MQEQLNIPGVGSVLIDLNDLKTGIDYEWSGDCKTKAEFIASSFLKTAKNEHTILLCTVENMPGLCDYLFTYVIESDLLSHLMFFVSPDMDYSCFLAWEQGNPSYGDCGVVDEIIQFFIDDGLIHLIPVNNMKIFVLTDFDRYENGHYPHSIQDSIDKYCDEGIQEILEERLYREDVSVSDREEDICFLLSTGEDWIKPYLESLQVQFEQGELEEE